MQTCLWDPCSIYLREREGEGGIDAEGGKEKQRMSSRKCKDKVTTNVYVKKGAAYTGL